MPKAKPKPKPTKTVKADLPKPVLYVKVGGPPANWRSLVVWDVKARKYVVDIVEADAHHGWYRQALRDAAGNVQIRHGEYVTRRVERAIRIEPRV